MGRRQVIGWIGVALTIVISSLWAYWGAFENFHEGWYSESLLENISMLIFQYMAFSILFVVLALVTLKWKKFGLFLHFAVGGFCVWFFSGASFKVVGLMLLIPFGIIGFLYYFGEPRPKKRAYRMIIIVPLVIFLAISIPQGIKVSKRVNDGDFGARVVEGNDLVLVWAPRGPGWPDRGVSWEEAMETCRYLSEDGTKVMKDRQDIWRLPTVDEAVRSMSLRGINSGGVWIESKEKAEYLKTPDKETPLWDPNSKVIYYWTADTSNHDDERAYIVVYHGGVFDRKKSNSPSYLSFRAVKNPER